MENSKRLTPVLRKRVQSRKKDLGHRLLAWSRSNSPSYPWRQTSDPYRVLVAEMLLRKTKADQVKKVYERFIKRFPSLRAVYDADTERIRSIICTLGLDFRSAWIKEISRGFYEKCGNTIPSDEMSLEYALGKKRKYLLNALKCFAFGENIAMFDVNVRRILGRVFSIEFGSQAHKDQSSWKLASLLVPEGLSKEYNWAIIDLGRMICTPRRPKCNMCPIRGLCDYGRAAV